MPVLLMREDELAQWLHGSDEEAMRLARPCSDLDMRVARAGPYRKELLEVV
jgi:putative SOS response-associated peptidase YedK